MRLEDAIELTAVLAQRLDDAAIPSAFDSRGITRSFDGDRQAPCVGVGIALGHNANDVRIALRAWTTEDVESLQALAGRYLPRESELDLVITGEIRITAGLTPPGSLTGECRPVRPGVSIGHVHVTAGTLGALVTMEHGSNKQYMLSNNHVLANSIGVTNPNAAAKGDQIFQPGKIDHGTQAVGLLSHWVPLQRRGNVCDAALASCDDSIAWDPEILGLGPISGTADPMLGMDVQKVGKATGLRMGTISAYPLRSLPVKYGSDILRFNEVVEVMGHGEVFGDEGDSGSIVLDRHRAAVGLLFAGGSGVTYANPIADVQKALGFARLLGA